MVTYRQVGRTVLRTLRSIDRASKRAERQRIAQQFASEKFAQLEASAESARKYVEIVDSLTKCHAIDFRRRDWATTAKSPNVPDPERSSREEEAARASLNRYSPGLFSRAFGVATRKRDELVTALEAARARDEAAYRALREEAKTHNADIEYAQKLLALDHEAIEDSLIKYSSLNQLPFSVEGVDLLFTDKDRIVAIVDGLDPDDMPTQSITLLKSGRASIKALSTSRILELHRDNICSSSVRVAIEIMQVIPIDVIEVVMHTDLLDRATGHIRSTPILYVRVTAQALSSINLARTEPSALVEFLGGHFDWNKRNGFRAIGPESFNIPA